MSTLSCADHQALLGRHCLPNSQFKIHQWEGVSLRVYWVPVTSTSKHLPLSKCAGSTQPDQPYLPVTWTLIILELSSTALLTLNTRRDSSDLNRLTAFKEGPGPHLEGAMAAGRDKQTLLPISNGSDSVHHHGNWGAKPPTYFQCSIIGYQLPKHSLIFTLYVGFTFGFGIAYMALCLSGSGLVGRTEMFQGTPPYPEDHKVTITKLYYYITTYIL